MARGEFRPQEPLECAATGSGKIKRQHWRSPKLRPNGAWGFQHHEAQMMTRDVSVFGASILWCMALSGALLFLILI
jgi:hypothetical protein